MNDSKYKYSLSVHNIIQNGPHWVIRWGIIFNIIIILIIISCSFFIKVNQFKLYKTIVTNGDCSIAISGREYTTVNTSNILTIKVKDQLYPIVIYNIEYLNNSCVLKLRSEQLNSKGRLEGTVSLPLKASLFNYIIGG